MAELKAEYVNAFIMATHSLLTQMCMIAEVKVGKPSLEPAKFPEDTSLILIGLTGEITGHVMLVFPESTALDIISKMTMMPATEINDIGVSAISELGNMIMGNASILLSSQNVLIDITPPSYFQGSMTLAGGGKRLCIPLTYEDGKMLELGLELKVT
ncbi:MAG: chemotaxis protein CheX [Lachnospiraceae bacterium]|jgi:chemotaxis protein CheX|nr:chemotaxis protein CheX [Lachnospiraceae bacterium]MCX4317316.1 chemotaxis protein CheX [Lachnospiraceae bacterium]